MSRTNECLVNPQIFKNVQILVVDNDFDSRDLYTVLLGSYGAKVTQLGSIKDTLNLLQEYTPDIVICEMRFFGESVYPLIQKIRNLALNSNITIPILVTSTCHPINLVKELRVQVEAYLLKPFDLDHFVNEVWNLTHLSNITHSLSTQKWVTKQNINEQLDYVALVN